MDLDRDLDRDMVETVGVVEKNIVGGGLGGMDMDRGYEPSTVSHHPRAMSGGSPLFLCRRPAEKAKPNTRRGYKKMK